MNVPKLRFKGFSKDWENKELGEITLWKSGGTPSKDKSAYWNGDIPWISASTMRGIEYSDSNLKITEEGLRKGSKLAEKGSLLILVRGSMLFNKIPIGIAMRDLAFNQDVKSITVDKSTTSKYVLFWFISKENKILNLVTGTGIGAGKIDLSDLKKINLSIPKLEEQEKIASFFTAIDQKLNLLKEKKEKLELYKKGVMQQIFSQKLRFKDEKGNEFPEWEEKKVKDIFTITRGNVLAMPLVSETKTDNNLYPVYSSQTKKNGLSGYYSKYLFEDCITWTTDGAGAGDVNFRGGKFYCTNVCGVLISDKGYANGFISEILNSVSRKYVSYVGNPKLMNNVMAEIKISIPKSIIEQQKIADFLSALDTKINLVSTQIEKTELWKKGLLQQMFV